MTDKYLIEDDFDACHVANRNVRREDYDRRHGGPFDRGSADNYYGRAFSPHYYEGATYKGARIVPATGTAEYAAYAAGWDDNELQGDKKDWG